LSSPHLEASPATTFRACSSPAPNLVKPQLAPAILSQESVHTTLSITHHTRKRPSTGPRTTHGPQTEVASSDSSLGYPDRQVFMAAGDTLGPLGRQLTSTSKTSPQTSCLWKHPRMRLTPTGTLDVSATEDGRNGAGISEIAYPSATSQRPSNESRAGHTPPLSNVSY
jgi:hypothetical protein